MKLRFSTNPPIYITVSPQQLRAALPEGYDLVDLQDPNRVGGRTKRGKRGHIDRSEELVPDKDMTPVPLKDLLGGQVFPLFDGLPFTATSCLLHLNKVSLLAGEVVGNPIVMGRTLKTMVRDGYPGLVDIWLKGQRHYKYESPVGS